MEASAEQAQATTQFLVTGLTADLARTVRFLNQDWDFEWRYAAIFNKFDQLFLTPEALVELRAELWEVLSRYTGNPSTGPETHRVIFTMQGFPYHNDPSTAIGPTDRADAEPDGEATLPTTEAAGGSAPPT